MIVSGLKLENFLNEIYQWFFYVSCFEIAMFFMQAFWMVSRSQVNSVWYHVLGLVHPVRAVIGFYLSRQIP